MNALKANKVTKGGWIQSSSVAVADVIAGSGYFDWVCIDLEHGSIGIESMANMITTITAHGVTPVVRVPENNYKWIGRSLDAGAQGIIVPMISSVQEAELAVSYTKFPPYGIRGFGYAKYNGYGKHFDECMKKANDLVSLTIQIEHSRAMDNLHSILSVNGVDGSIIGPLDLRGSIDMNMSDMLFDKWLKKYVETCREVGSPAGIHVVDPVGGDVDMMVESGYKTIAVGTDMVLLRQGVDNVL
ncbi:hypothetical protein KAR91_20685 [Candidatus Pacearchaeota archaeon]|nr:hypothetical protein [Candidatus Pacearchaeota archaeon]